MSDSGFGVFFFAWIVFMVILLAVWRRLRALPPRRGRAPIGSRDQLYAGVVPGVIPAEPETAPTRPATAQDTAAPIAVRFSPPDGITPEQTGMLTRARVEDADLAAALVALAVDGHIRLEQRPVPDLAGEQPGVPGAQPGDVPGAQPVEWRIEPLGPRPAGPALLRGWVYDSVQRAFPSTLPGLGEQLRDNGSPGRAVFAGIPEHREWYPRMKEEPGRFGINGARHGSARATALRYQLAGFKQFLATADGDRLRFDEGAGLFSRYLPWAVALGVTQEWTRALREAAVGLPADARETWQSDLSWFGASGWFDPVGLDGLTDFGAAIDSLADGLTEFSDSLGDAAAGDAGGDGGDGGGGNGGGGGGD